MPGQEVSPLIQNVGADQEAPTNARKILEAEFTEFLAIPETKDIIPYVEKGDSDIPMDMVDKFLGHWWDGGYNARIGDMEGLSNLLLDAKLDSDGSGTVDERELADQAEEAKLKVEAASNFMLNVALVSALLVTIQLGLILVEAEMHPMTTAVLNKLEQWMHIDLTWYYDSVYYSEDSVTEEAVEVHVLTYLAQHLSTMWLLYAIKDNISLITQSTKAYGHIMYWAADLPTKLWYVKTGQVQCVQGAINEAGSGFLRSLLPYICLSRGPIIAAFLFYLSRLAAKEFDQFNGTGAAMLIMHQGTKVKNGSWFKK